jgi:hypothetical protein
VLSLTVRTWVHYFVPLTVIAALAMFIFAITGLRVALPGDLNAARIEMFLGWRLAATAWIFQIALVAAAAPAVRSIAIDEPLTQLQAFTRGIVNLARAIVPVGVALLAIVLGSVALLVPGLLLLGLFSLTGASEHLADPLPAPLMDSVEVVRANGKRVALVLLIIIGADLAIAAAAHLAILPALPKKPPVSVLAPTRNFVRIVAFALIAASPIPACALAALYGSKRQTA